MTRNHSFKTQSLIYTCQHWSCTALLQVHTFSCLLFFITKPGQQTYTEKEFTHVICSTACYVKSIFFSSAVVPRPRITGRGNGREQITFASCGFLLKIYLVHWTQKGSLWVQTIFVLDHDKPKTQTRLIWHFQSQQRQLTKCIQVIVYVVYNHVIRLLVCTMSL